MKQASAGAVFQGIRGVPRDWIDAALPAGARAAVLWTGRADRFTVNQNEFFNRAVGPVYYLRQPTPGGVGETQVRVDPRDGVVHLPDGTPLSAEYLLTDGSVTPDGEVVARDDLLGTTLWRVGGRGRLDDLDQGSLSERLLVGGDGDLEAAALPGRRAGRVALERPVALRVAADGPGLGRGTACGAATSSIRACRRSCGCRSSLDVRRASSGSG